ncbi:hypothetical protein KP509_16G020000 [Ceratopteris richardii]|uniref:Uncharacterized protein n=1 Tax=Ceratopteris richardii TaxID=49495 RepID=A0A8T2T2Q8_CERRI|nr:hypothetical protein KP509_16G020000 [Ceratopteris richardii]
MSVPRQRRGEIRSAAARTTSRKDQKHGLTRHNKESSHSSIETLREKHLTPPSPLKKLDMEKRIERYVPTASMIPQLLQIRLLWHLMHTALRLFGHNKDPHP